MWSRNQAKAKRDENLTVGNERYRRLSIPCSEELLSGLTRLLFFSALPVSSKEWLQKAGSPVTFQHDGSGTRR